MVQPVLHYIPDRCQNRLKIKPNFGQSDSMAAICGCKLVHSSNDHKNNESSDSASSQLGLQIQKLCILYVDWLCKTKVERTLSPLKKNSEIFNQYFSYDVYSSSEFEMMHNLIKRNWLHIQENK